MTPKESFVQIFTYTALKVERITSLVTSRPRSAWFFAKLESIMPRFAIYWGLRHDLSVEDELVLLGQRQSF